MSDLIAQDVLTPQHIALIKSQYAQDATDDELALFLHRANSVGLDPLSGEIHFVKRKGRATIQTGIDGYRKIAHSTGEMDGYGPTIFYDTNGNAHQVWLEDGPPAAAQVTVYRKGHVNAYQAQARYGAYVAKTKEGKITQFWLRMPDIMLAKCAEAMALRKAFPGQLSGLYVQDEMQTNPHVVIPRADDHQEMHPTNQVRQPELDQPHGTSYMTFKDEIAKARSVKSLKSVASKISAAEALLNDGERDLLRQDWVDKMETMGSE